MKKILVILCAIFVVSICASSAMAVPVSLFYDGSYVDTGREAPYLNTQLGALGHTTTTFAGTSEAAWSTALGAANVLVVPELERGNLSGALSTTTKTNIASFVFGGGNFIVSGSHTAYGVSLLNSVFGYSLAGTNHSWTSSTLNAGDAAGTTFAGGPDPLPSLNATWSLVTTSLPVGALNIYSRPGYTTVMANSYGAGNAIFLAYDWYQTASDPSWGSVLDSAVTMAPIPEPATMLLLGSGLVGLAGFRRKKKK